MKNFIISFFSLFVVSCTTSDQKCTDNANGFIDGNDGQVKMGSQNAVDIFNEIDKAWADLDYETLKSYVAEDAEMRFHDGRVAVGPEEKLMQRIKRAMSKDIMGKKLRHNIFLQRK